MTPPTHSNPSPNVCPRPEFIATDPCTYRHGPLGIPEPASTSESLARLGMPIELNRPPFALLECAQPLPGAPGLSQGHAVCDPPPTHVTTPGAHCVSTSSNTASRLTPEAEADHAPRNEVTTPG